MTIYRLATVKRLKYILIQIYAIISAIYLYFIQVSKITHFNIKICNFCILIEIDYVQFEYFSLNLHIFKLLYYYKLSNI